MKHLFKNTLGIFILLLASTCQIFSQEITVNKLPLPEGNTIAQVTGIVQDQYGFMWFATLSGLYKYDGYQITTYKHNPEDPNSLANDAVLTIAADSSGIIWLGNYKGLDRFDPNTGQFKHYTHDPENHGSIGSGWINSLLVDHEGILWIGGAGLNQYDRESDSFKLYSNIPGDSTSLSNNFVWTIYEDKMGTIWVGTADIWNNGDDFLYSGGLNKFNKQEGTFTRYLHDPNNSKSLINNKVTAIFEDSYGTFWVGTAGDGLHTMDREKGTFERHTHDPKHPEKLSRPPFIEKDNPHEHISFINEDAAGAIWIGTFNFGLVYYEPKTRKTMAKNDFKGDEIDQMPRTIFSSREGVLWIGTEIGNIYHINRIKNKIPQYTAFGRINSFYEEPDGTLWMLNDKEIIRTKTNGTINRIVIDENPSTFLYNTVKTIKEDRQGDIWFGSDKGLFRWDKKNESFINYKINPNNKYSSGNNVWTIYEDRKANFWIGKARGLTLLDRETGSATEFLIYPNDTAEFGKNAITSILEDKTGKLWIGSWFGGGLYQFNTETKEFKNMLNFKYVGCIYEDTDGVLWAVGGDNLYKYDSNTENFIPYKDRNLPFGILAAQMVEDNQKYLWIGSWDNTIVRLNPERDASVVYNKNTGVENRLEFGSAYKGRNGNLYFGNENGYYSFDPKELTSNSTPPNIVFTAFLLADKPVNPGNDSPLNESLLQAKEIRLNYNQNVFTFEFAALDYSNPEETRYSCMLENYDSNWRKGNSERRA